MEPSSKAPGIGGSQPLYATFTGDVDYEHKYPPDAYGEELSATARVWSVYNDEAHVIDAQMIRSFNSTLDVLLVFVRRAPCSLSAGLLTRCRPVSFPPL